MGVARNSSSFTCEIRILGGKNIEPSSSENLFVRIYLTAGNNKRVKLNTMEISSNSKVFWGEAFLLECVGPLESVEKLKQETVVLELRRKNTVPIFGNLTGSKLLGRAEITWREVFESPMMAVGKWVSMVSATGRIKSPEIEMEMAVRSVQAAEEVETRRRRDCEGDCGCRNGRGFCEDYNVFAFATTF